MRLLLDTHTLLWLLSNHPQLSAKARAAIIDDRNEKLLSIGSLWEIAIKVGKGRLDIGQSLADFLAKIENNRVIRQLPIRSTHLLQLASLPAHHGDPFDRLIVAQALSEGCALVSCDLLLDAYGVTRLW